MTLKVPDNLCALTELSHLLAAAIFLGQVSNLWLNSGTLNDGFYVVDFMLLTKSVNIWAPANKPKLITYEKRLVDLKSKRMICYPVSGE